MRDIDSEAVASGTTGKTSCISDQLVNAAADPLQHQITVVFSIQFVYDMKTVDVDNNSIHKYLILFIQPFSVFIEEFLVEKLRQPVSLRLMNDDAVFGKLNRMFHTGSYDFGGFVGLCDKIRCSHFQALDFRTFLGSQHDHGNTTQHTVRADDLEQPESIKFGHMQIKDHYRRDYFSLPENIQCSYTVFSIHDLVQIAQHRTKHFTLDEFIINDQNASVKSFFSFKQFLHIAPHFWQQSV